jgi:hypothetical protein
MLMPDQACSEKVSAPIAQIHIKKFINAADTIYEAVGFICVDRLVFHYSCPVISSG